MKDFIEAYNDKGNKLLININHIKFLRQFKDVTRLYLTENELIYLKGDYEYIVRLIEEATESKSND